MRLLNIVKDAGLAVLVLLATFLIGLTVAFTFLSWPDTTSVFGLGISVTLWLLAMIGSGIISKFQPKITVLSMAWLIFLTNTVLANYSMATTPTESVALYREYGIDAYSMNFTLLTVFCVATAIFIAKGTEPYLTDAFSWLWGKVRAPAEPEAA